MDEKANAGGGETVRFYYAGSRVIEDADASTTVQRHFVWGNYIDELLLMRDVAGTGGTANTDYVVASDHRYSPVALIKKSDGTVVGGVTFRL